MARADDQTDDGLGASASRLDLTPIASIASIAATHAGSATATTNNHPTLLLPSSGTAAVQTSTAGATAVPTIAPAQAGTDRSRNAHRLGPYTLLRIIGHGGMGAVWEAVDHRLDRHVALKVMTGNASPEAEERFRREAHHSARLRHANIVAVHDFGSDGGRQYLVMDLLQGDTLTEALRTNRLSYRDKAAILIKICRAVHYAHEQGVIHRDLKPSNIILEVSRRGSSSNAGGETQATSIDPAQAPSSPIGEPLVMDFGLAKDTTSDSSLSQSGLAMGTPSYMPPEQAEGRLPEIGPRSDVYSLGAILYEMLTGRPPFTGENVMQVLRAVSHDDPIAPRQISPDVARDLETICLTCLAKLPARRYASAAALADDLGAWLTGDHIRARPPTWIQRSARLIRRHRSMVTTVALGVAILAATTIGFMVSLQEKRDAALRAEGEAIQAEDQAKAALAASAASHRAEMLSEQKRLDAETRRLALETKADADRARIWRLVLSDDFSDPAASMRQWQTLSGEPLPIAGGALHAGPEFVLTCRTPLAGDIRIDWDCTFTSHDIDDLSCFMCAVANQLGNGRIDPGSGYEFKSGAFSNSKNMLIRRSVPLVVQPIAGLVPDHAYHARAEKIGNHLRYIVDGAVLLDVTDPTPIDTAGREVFVGLTSWHGNEQWRNVRIYALGVPRTADLLEIARAELTSGHAQAAVDLFQEVVDSASDDERRLAASDGLRQAEGLRNVQGYRQVLGLAYPGRHILVNDLGDGTVSVMAAASGLTDISAFHGIPVSDLNLHGDAITDCTPLAGMPLTTLDIGDNHHLDLRTLAGLHLHVLNIDSDGIDSLAPLHGMPLTTLSCAGNGLASLAGLEGDPLAMLNGGSNHITSLEPLRGMPLQHVWLSDNDLTDLAPLAGSAITFLDLAANHLDSLAPLHGMPLATLRFSQNQVVSLEPLRGMATLRVLTGDENRIADLNPLRGLRLRSVILNDNDLSDLSPLQGMPLTMVLVDGNHIHSIQPLRGCALEWLWIAGNPLADAAAVVPGFTGLRMLNCCQIGLTDLSFLAHLPLKDLRCSRNPITSLEALRGMPLQILFCSDTKVTSLDPLAHAPLAQLWMMDDPLDDIAAIITNPPGTGLVPLDAVPDRQLVAAEAAWRTTNPLLALTAAAQLAARSHRGDLLEAKATLIDGHHYLLLAEGRTFEGARQAAQRLGGHLAIIRSRAAYDALLPMIRATTPVCEVWLGGRRTAAGLVWDDGERAGFDATMPEERGNVGPLIMDLTGWHVHTARSREAYQEYVVEWDQ